MFIFASLFISAANMISLVLAAGGAPAPTGRFLMDFSSPPRRSFPKMDLLPPHPNKKAPLDDGGPQPMDVDYNEYDHEWSTEDGGSGESSPMETEDDAWEGLSDPESPGSDQLPEGNASFRVVEQGPRKELRPNLNLKLPIRSLSERLTVTKDDVWFVAEFLDQLSSQAETILEGADRSPWGVAAARRRSGHKVQAVFQADVAAFWAQKAAAQAEVAKEQSGRGTRSSDEESREGGGEEKAAAALLAAAKAEIAAGKAEAAWKVADSVPVTTKEVFFAKTKTRKAKETAAAAAVQARRAADAVVPVVVQAAPQPKMLVTQKPEGRPRPRPRSRSDSPVPYRRAERSVSAGERENVGAPRGRTLERRAARERSAAPENSISGVFRSVAAWCCSRFGQPVQTTEECECPAGAPTGAALSETQQHEVAAWEAAALLEDKSTPFPQTPAIKYQPASAEELERVRSLWQTRGFFELPAPFPDWPHQERFGQILAWFEGSRSGIETTKYVRILDGDYSGMFCNQAQVVHEAVVRALIYIERLLRLSADSNAERRMYLNHGATTEDQQLVWLLQSESDDSPRAFSVRFSKPLLRAMVSKLAIRRTFLAAMVLALESLSPEFSPDRHQHHPWEWTALSPEQLQQTKRHLKMMLGGDTEIAPHEVAERLLKLRREGGEVPVHTRDEDLTGWSLLLRRQPEREKCNCGRGDCSNPL